MAAGGEDIQRKTVALAVQAAAVAAAGLAVLAESAAVAVEVTRGPQRAVRVDSAVAVAGQTLDMAAQAVLAVAAAVRETCWAGARVDLARLSSTGRRAIRP